MNGYDDFYNDGPQEIDYTKNSEIAIKAKDGRVIQFHLQRGSIVDGSTGKFSKTTRATHVHPNGKVSAFEWSESESQLQISGASLKEELRNNGLGLALYQIVADEAIAKGKGLASDSSVSSEALKIYPKLAAMGYKVEYADEGNVVGVANEAEEGFSTRPVGSVQIIGRDERPVARILGRGEPDASGLPEHLKKIVALGDPARAAKAKADEEKRLAASAATPSFQAAIPAAATLHPTSPAPWAPSAPAPQFGEQPRPAAPPLPANNAQPAAMGLVPQEQMWLVDVEGVPHSVTASQLKSAALRGRFDAETLVRPADNSEMWLPAGQNLHFASVLAEVNAPKWHVSSMANLAPGQERSTKGPLSDRDICRMGAEGSLTPLDVAWKPGMENWAPVGLSDAAKLQELGQSNPQAFLPELNMAQKLAARRENALANAPQQTPFQMTSSQGSSMTI